MFCMKNILLIVLIIVSIISGSTTVAHSDLNDGLVAYYPFNGNANDESGNANNGTVNGATLTIDRNGNLNGAYYFNGSSYITIPFLPQLNPVNQWTMSFWIYIDDFTNVWSAIIHKGGRQSEDDSSSCLSNREYTVWVNSAYSFHQTSAGDNTCQKVLNTQTNSFVKGKWLHYVGIIDRVNHFMKIYINGQLSNRNIDSYNTFNNNISNLRIGSTEEINSTYSPFKGKLDDFCFYNRALSDSEIQELYTEQTTTRTSPATSITSNSATLNGTVNPNSSSSTTYYFEYGTTTSYGTKTASQSVGSGNTALAVTADITGLTPDTTYHFRVIATNSVGTTNGNDLTFITLATDHPDLNDGLVAYYPFNGNANDESGNKNHGAVNGATLTADRNGNADSAYSFDGIDDRIKLPNTIISSVPMTLNLWVKTDDVEVGLISGATDSTTDNEYLIYWDTTTSSNITIYYHHSNIQTNIKINDNIWHMLSVITMIDKTILYVDGKLVETALFALNGSFNIQGLWLGGDQDCVNGCFESYQQFNGFMDDIRIYNRALSDSEIQALGASESLISNLTVTSISVPSSAQLLTQSTISWNIKNSGQKDAAGSWVDQLYLSSDETLGSDDILLGEFTKSNGLGGDTEYQQTEKINIPKVEAGFYYIILKADSNSTLNESDETDNIFVQPITITTAKIMTATPDRIELSIVGGNTQTGSLQIGNISTIDMNGITATVKNVPSNITVQITPPTLLKSLTSQTITYAVKAVDDSVSTGEVTVLFEDSQGNEASVLFVIKVLSGTPKLAANPGYLESGMLRGSQRSVEFELSNIGGASADNLKIAVPQASWLKLVTPENIGNLAAGAKTNVVLMLKPSNDMTLGPYTGELVVSGSSANLRVGFKFTAISDAKGSLKVIAEDEFTYFAEDKPNVAGAEVLVKDAFDNSKVIAQGTTDETGIFTASDINEGRYDIEVRAEKHSSYRSTVGIVPGSTKEVKAFMSRQFVSYKWSVEPVEIEDNYTVVLEAEFETHVPAPVVTVEPKTQVALIPEGGTGTVNVTVTNHGLIAALGVTLDFAESDEYYVEPLIKDIGLLTAMSSVVVPVNIRAKVDGPITNQTKMRTEKTAQAGLVSEKLSDSLNTTNRSSQNGYDLCDFLSGKIRSYYYCSNAVWKEVSFSIKPLILGLDAITCASGSISACQSFAESIYKEFVKNNPEIALGGCAESEDEKKCISNIVGGASCLLGKMHDCITLGTSTGFIDPCVGMIMHISLDSKWKNLLYVAQCAACSMRNVDILSGPGVIGDGGPGGLGIGGWGELNISTPFWASDQPLSCDPATEPKSAKTDAEATPSDISRYGGRIVKYKVIGK